jgi:iron(III) transport system ATP-binding protein
MYLTLENIVKVFPPRGGSSEVTAVNGVSIAIDKGELVTLLGPSGCGKTTTLRLIAGFEFPTSGSIRLDGQEINVLPPHKREMSMVFQSYAIFPHLKLYENIAYGLNVKHVPGPEIKQRVARVMELVQLTGLEARAPNQLSGGQQQRVALARALVMEPKVLLMDEPLSNLDAKLREQMRTEIRHIQQRLGITSVYVTHDQIEAMTLSDRVVVMHEGGIEQVGPPMEVYRRPRTRFVANFIGRANFVEGRVAGRDPGVLHVNALGATFHLTNVTAFPAVNTPVTMIVRPEMINVRKAGGQLHGIVRRAAYLGDRIDYDIAVCGDEVNGQVLMAVENDPSHLELHPEGSTVELSFSEDCIHILPEAAGLPTTNFKRINE